MSELAKPLLLLIEDEFLLLDVADEALRESGFETLPMATVDEALAELEQDAARFAGVVTDVNLGNKATGWDIARRARELIPSMPVVYMTGGNNQDDWLANGVPNSQLVLKPFAHAQLVTAISTAMNTG